MSDDSKRFFVGFLGMLSVFTVIGILYLIMLVSPTASVVGLCLVLSAVAGLAHMEEK